MHVWVIMGGASAEREVSLDTGRAVCEALRGGDHRVWAYDLRDGTYLPDVSSEDAPPPADPAAELPRQPSWAERLLRHAVLLRDARAEVAFLALHGTDGEDGTVQALLETAGFPYTGSGPTASAVSMDKSLSKWIMEALGIPTPKWLRLPVAASAEDAEPASDAAAPSGALPLEILGRAQIEALPVVVKPVAQGSSVGITIVHEAAQWTSALREAARWSVKDPDGNAQVIVEEYIPGRELTVGIVCGRVLPLVEIRPKTGFYDYKRKYTPGESEYVVPADLPKSDAKQISDRASRLARAIGARGIVRVDFRMTPGGSGYCLELNTIPGLTSTSLIPKAAASLGLSFRDLLESACQEALRGASAAPPG
ncbi:MAG: D-alanine--D-alanine ligase [Candidatus Eisenbacteria bacterium]|nr:D-alanine--D-alanine ligase [Candidatus Eisenbacteria bacterium]